MRHVKAFLGFVFILFFGYGSLGLGQAWTSLEIPTGETLRAIHFPSPAQGWAAGYNGTILHSSDGGMTWSKQSSGTSERFLAIRFVNEQVGWAGAGRYVTRTVDGGSTWKSVGADPSPFRFRNSLFPVSANQAWAPVNSSGTPGTSRWFSRYTVQGNGSVLEEDFNVLGSSAQFLDIFFVDEDTGWSVGTPGQIIKITEASSESPGFDPQPSGTSVD